MPDQIVGVLIVTAEGVVSPGPGQTSADVPAPPVETEK